jgi:hypothetical protein
MIVLMPGDSDRVLKWLMIVDCVTAFDEHSLSPLRWTMVELHSGQFIIGFSG